MRRLSRILVVMGLHRERVKGARCESGRDEKRYVERKVSTAERLSSRWMRISSLGGEGI